MNEEKKDIINETFRKVASNTAQDSKMRFLEGEQKYQESKEDGEFEQQSLIDKAGENYAFATEIALKGNIIYDDFRKNPRFNQTETKLVNINGKEIQCYGIGTPEWHESLSAEHSDARILNDPKEIKKLILENNPNDERKKLVTSENRKNAEYKSLKFDDEKKVSGHSLYAYYQLQDGVAKNLINTEYYCYLEDKVKYTVYALLTEDILTTSNFGKTIMPKEMMEFLDTNKELAISLRYASISGKNINPKDFKFIREFSNSVVNACEYRFPLPKDYNQFDFEKYNYNNFKYKEIKIFSSLDEVAKYKLQSCFSNEEITTMLNYVNILINAKLDISSINIFINNCIYFKHYVKNILKINLKFTEKQYGRIDNFCKLIKAFQPFDENSKLLRDNEAFDSKEKIDHWKEKVEEIQKMEQAKMLIAIKDSILIANPEDFSNSYREKQIAWMGINDGYFNEHIYEKYIKNAKEDEEKYKKGYQIGLKMKNNNDTKFEDAFGTKEDLLKKMAEYDVDNDINDRNLSEEASIMYEEYKKYVKEENWTALRLSHELPKEELVIIKKKSELEEQNEKKKNNKKQK